MKETSSVSNTPVSKPLVIKASRGWPRIDWRELWDYRELILFLAWRDIKVRYRQTALGAAWVIIQPLLTMVAFTLVFHHLARIPTGDTPYPVFAYTALLPWSFFARSLSTSGNSLVSNNTLVTKVYFPRLVIPIASVLGCAVDFAVAFVVLLVMLPYYGITPGIGVLALPFFILVAAATALGVGVCLSVVTARFRDVRQVVPYLMQLWLYATPVAYPSTLVPEKWRPLLALNPMTGVVEGFRWALLGTGRPPAAVLAISMGMVMVLLAGSIHFFRHAERTLADII